MALSKQPSDLKNRVITCLNKLSDRDTLSIASNELESIAKNLSHDSFAPFLTCLTTTDSSEKSPVRRQCVRLITILSTSHGDDLSPHLAKLLSAIIRRIRDPDSTVRSACVEAISSISSHITKPPFSAITKPLLDCIFHEQDYNAQIGASLCLASAVEAAPEPDITELKKHLPKLLKLVKSDCFKAKSAMISLIGCIASFGGASSKNAANSLIPIIVDFLTSEDWTARKAAAETLMKLAMAERNSLAEHKSSCLASLESRKFDKVKAVRETMNRAVEIWKDIPEVSDEGVLRSKSKPSVKDTINTENTQTKKTSSQKKGGLTSNDENSKKLCEGRVEVNVPQLGNEEGQKSKKTMDGPDCFNSTPETKRVLFPEKSRKFSNLKLRSRVVPFTEEEDNNLNEDCFDGHKEFEDFSLIRKQLIQIENQQSNLMELLQSFIGSSQNGMNSLEQRVKGLEKVVDEMSREIGLSTRRVSGFSGPDSSGNACCMLAGAEFLSPKFWRKTEGQSSHSNKSLLMNVTPRENPINQQNVYSKPSMENIYKETMEALELHKSKRIQSKIQGDKSSQARASSKLRV